jgi:hypothetical protein
MHDPGLRHAPYFHREVYASTQGTSLTAAVRQTVQDLLDRHMGSFSDEEIAELLRGLGLRDKSFLYEPKGFVAMDVLREGYRAVNAIYWHQMQLEGKWKTNAHRFTSQIFRYGIGPAVEFERDRRIVFSVYAFPACPVFKAYGSDMEGCKKACQERSRHGTFTNPLVTRALAFYHPRLTLRLYQFRKHGAGPCTYQLILQD